MTAADTHRAIDAVWRIEAPRLIAGLARMMTGAFRAAGDPRTPLRLGVTMTVLTVIFNVILIPRLGTLGAALGTIASSTIAAGYCLWKTFQPGSVIQFHRGMGAAALTAAPKMRSATASFNRLSPWRIVRIRRGRRN